MPKINRILLALILPFLFITTLRSAAEDALEIIVTIPQIKTLPAYSPKRVAISNPQIADVTAVRETEIVLTPKAPGKTTLVVWDSRGQRAYSVRVISEDLEDAKFRIDKLISELGYQEVYSKISKEEDKILLLGSINNEGEKAKLDSLLTGFSAKLIDLVEVKEDNDLIQIDVEILEISKDELDDLGFDWASSISGTDTVGVKWTEKETPSYDIYKFGQLSRIWDRGAISAQLNLLITRGKGRVLSRPKLVCLSGKEASFLVGGEIPVISTVAGSSGNSVNVEYKEYGIRLDIKPTVKSDKSIQAALKIEVSEIDKANAVIAAGTYAVAFTKRNAETELYLGDNQTVFLAGLIKSKESKNVAKLPALGDLPILGALFRSKNFELGETELVISLTPHIFAQENKQKTVVSAAERQLPKSLLEYYRTVQDRISKAVVYPEMARRENLEGEVDLSLHILRDGRLLNVIVHRPSGSKLLDDVSVNIVKAQAPFPPFPAATDLNEIWVDVPIVFKNNLDERRF